MEIFAENEARAQFDTLLMKAQSKPVQINKHRKPIAMMISMEAYEYFEELKLKALQDSFVQAEEDM